MQAGTGDRGGGTKTYRNVLVSGAGTVDKLNDRVGVVYEVDGQSLVGESVAVRGDEGLKVIGDFLRGGIAHAVRGRALGSPA